MKFAAFMILLTAIAVRSHSPAEAEDSNTAAASRAERKIQHIEKNAESAHPNPAPTEFSEVEINAYVAAGKVKLPEGVHSVVFEAQPGVVVASCRVDFDEVKAGRHSANPFLSLFSGIHDVNVTANASGNQGRGVVDVQSVILDGVEIPRFILELFVQKFLQPKYPSLGLVSHFALPERIDSAKVDILRLTLTQK